jgi:ADP-ribose pyrophosphatase YjhB (NUDIX family)
MTLPDALHFLDQLAGDARTGLPEDLFLFVSRVTPLVNVDLLIQDQDPTRGRGTLLTWRNDQFYGAGWHIPGGIIRYKETAHQRIQEVARGELGASVEFDPAPLTVVESMSRERNRGHFISLLYLCRLTSPLDPHRQALTDPPEPGAWRWHTDPPPDLLEAHKIYQPFLTSGS